MIKKSSNCNSRYEFSQISMHSTYPSLMALYLANRIPKMKNPRIKLFDVTLRDGLQSMQNCWSLNEKRIYCRLSLIKESFFIGSRFYCFS